MSLTTNPVGVMEQSTIFAPFFCMIALTACVWVYMYSRRIPFIQRGKLTRKQLRPAEFDRLSPPEVSNPSDNLKNLFEIPVIFYALCLYLYATSQVDSTYLVASWIFVILRILHCVIHSTVNIILLRFALYAVSTMAVWFIALRAAIGHFWPA